MKPLMRGLDHTNKLIRTAKDIEQLLEQNKADREQREKNSKSGAFTTRKKCTKMKSIRLKDSAC